ncbi:TPA: phospholipase D family protein [Enterococcus faecium]|nr:hypothetical protein [Enterococcus faecium]EMF0388136.1 phospholipase D family protein [Enterococcus faecium]
MFYFQDPNLATSPTLHEILLANVKNANSGGGAYAFASVGGVKLLLRDKDFQDYLEDNEFHLIIGTDSITSEEAIVELQAIQNKYRTLKINGYLNPNSQGSLFHPKFSWFEFDDGRGKLIIGSGNMTVKGLRQNKEAIGEIELDSTTLNQFKNEWFKWIEENDSNLYPIDSLEVLDRVKLNDFKYMDKIASFKSKTDKDIKDVLNIDLEMTEEDDTSPWNRALDDEVLICEIPKGGSRWSQANFSKYIFEEYFGATAGINSGYRILIRNQNSNGDLKEIESRPSVSVKSKNFRFELDAAKGKKYPTGKKKPIAIFLKVGVRMFKYCLLMPGDPYYTECNSFLDKFPREGTRVKRRIVKSVLLLNECGELPILK